MQSLLDRVKRSRNSVLEENPHLQMNDLEQEAKILKKQHTPVLHKKKFSQSLSIQG